MSDEQQENIRQLSVALGNNTELKPMSYKDANNGACNPLRDDENCQSVVVAFEVRRRGIDCYALIYSRQQQDFFHLGERFQDAFISAKSGMPIEPTLIKGKTRKGTITKLAKELRTPGRYILGINKGKKGHVVSIDVTENKEILIHDEQDNSDLVLASLIDNDYFELIKIDKALLNIDRIKSILRLN